MGGAARGAEWPNLGWAVLRTQELSGWMVSRYDGEGDEACHSCAVAFVRRPPAEVEAEL